MQNSEPVKFTVLTVLQEVSLCQLYRLQREIQDLTAYHITTYYETGKTVLLPNCMTELFVISSWGTVTFWTGLDTNVHP